MVMTDKKNDNRNGMNLEPLSAADDQRLQAFFADNRMEEIPDDGFSDRVMQALPGLDQEKTGQSVADWSICGRQPVWLSA